MKDLIQNANKSNDIEFILEMCYERISPRNELQFHNKSKQETFSVYILKYKVTSPTFPSYNGFPTFH